MESIGQDVSNTPGLPVFSRRRLRANLTEEESEEAVEAMYYKPDLLQAAKENADLIVIAEGNLVEFGFDPDEVYGIIMEENEQKVKYGEFDEDGKFVVSDYIKEKLKQETEQKLRKLIEE
jgi:predicted HAD superfamily Cof-like phosphohydrolase